MRQTVPVIQQNHSPEVVQSVGQPPPCAQVLQVKRLGDARSSQRIAGEKQGLQGPPPQPTQPPDTDPSETFVRVRNKPAPSEPAPRNLKNWRREDLPASAWAVLPARSKARR
jgi:hypothetical protein